jgi:hypothetical protein
MRALQTRGAHQPRDALLSDPDPLAAQHRVHPRAAVAAARGGVDLADALGQPRVLKRAV